MTDESKRPDDPIPSDLVREDASFEKIVQEFVAGLGQRLESMEQALVAGDIQALRTAAHRLKGSGGGHGYAILSELAAQTERDSVSGDLEAVRRDLEELRNLISRVVVRLD